MANLTTENKIELRNEELVNKKVSLKWHDSSVFYTLVKDPNKNGAKGLLWIAKDDYGDDVALKIVSKVDYQDRSIKNEILLSKKLSANYFSEIKTFGELDIEGQALSGNYYGIVSKWVEGKSFSDFVRQDLSSAIDFINIAIQLFTALADLYNNKLTHDDLHTGNILIEKRRNELDQEEINHIVIVDTGTIKPIETRERLLHKLIEDIKVLEMGGANISVLQKKRDFLKWKTPDDHIRVVDALIEAANGLIDKYSKLEFWERKFIDRLKSFFEQLIDLDPQRRLTNPVDIIRLLNKIEKECRKTNYKEISHLTTPFDYISSEMIRNDTEFSDLFSLECPWLEDCKSIQPLYIFGPRGCGKSSVLRWLSFKTVCSDDRVKNLESLREIGVYISCSVELRSRFWLLSPEIIENVTAQTIRYFNLLLLEELFDTLHLMSEIQEKKEFDFEFDNISQKDFTDWFFKRIQSTNISVRLQGQSYFEFLKSFIRREKWEAWGSIQKNEKSNQIPDASLVSDVVKEISQRFSYFKERYISFLIDDYSNQRIPVSIQKKLNQAISFAKQSVPLFKVSSEYHGIDLEGIQEGREVVQINIGDKYTSLNDTEGTRFIESIINKRLKKTDPPYIKEISEILGQTSYHNITDAIANETTSNPFYYYGSKCINWLCSGDVSLALDIIKKIFEKSSVKAGLCQQVSAKIQHSIIQEFSADEIRRIKYIVPYGEEMFEIVIYLGYMANAFVRIKKSNRRDKHKAKRPLCKTHLDIRFQLLSELKNTNRNLFDLLNLLMSKAILFEIDSSRQGVTFDPTQRLQIRRIYLPAFKAPLKRDAPIKIDTLDELIFLLTDPKNFVKNELKNASINESQLRLSIDVALIKPKTI